MSVKRVTMTIPIPLPDWKWTFVMLFLGLQLLNDAAGRIKDAPLRDMALSATMLCMFWLGCWYRGRLGGKTFLGNEIGSCAPKETK